MKQMADLKQCFQEVNPTARCLTQMAKRREEDLKRKRENKRTCRTRSEAARSIRDEASAALDALCGRKQKKECC